MNDHNCPNGARLAREFAERAASIRRGDGTPRIPQQIEREIACALESAYLRGRAAGADETRKRYTDRARMVLEGAANRIQNAIDRLDEA